LSLSGREASLNRYQATTDKVTRMTIHPTVEISHKATIGTGCQIWHYTQIREGATIGDQCIIGRDVYIDADVRIGSQVKIQNGAFIYRGATLEDGVFVGPRACLTNDRYPRAITPCGRQKGQTDWNQGSIHVGYGASIGAGAIIITDVTIGRFAMIGAGAGVTHNVPDHGLVLGTPAQLVGYVCKCGYRLDARVELDSCAVCGWRLPSTPAFNTRIGVPKELA
jgi:UDP-2-acetamido-3-amino-2,3-dideoxy-glucuronate N-acetyltransferase